MTRTPRTERSVTDQLAVALQNLRFVLASKGIARSTHVEVREAEAALSEYAQWKATDEYRCGICGGLVHFDGTKPSVD